MTLVIISKDNNDQKRTEGKHYIILDQEERMYLCEGGFFVSKKHLALGINKKIVALTALFKLNELRAKQKIRVLCTLVYE